MRLLDLFCCGGGAARGYSDAGFDVTGIDIEPQPRYPFKFIQADALDYLQAYGHEYDVVHASPPCQGYSKCQFIVSTQGKTYPLLIEPTIAALRLLGKPWVVENVPGSGLDSLVLCGSMFGLPIQRHRHFASSFSIVAPGICQHSTDDLGIYANKITRLGTKGTAYVAGSGRTHYRPKSAPFSAGCDAMGIDWMNRYELSQAIPPAYTYYIGKRMIQHLQSMTTIDTPEHHERATEAQ